MNTQLTACDGYKMSDCCGAEIILTDICRDCKEHCSPQCINCDDINDCENCNI